MSTFQESKEHIEQKMLLKIMAKIEDDPIVSQRRLATELGVALGLMNTYLKRCIKKGWLRANQVPAKRLAYFLTPEGFKEKSRMVKQYLSSSFTFFRDARSQCEKIFSECKKQEWYNIALIGGGDLAETAGLVAHGLQIMTQVVSENTNFDLYDAVLITDIEQPQQTYDFLKSKIEQQRLLTLALLHISRNMDMEDKQP